MYGSFWLVPGRIPGVPYPHGNAIHLVYVRWTAPMPESSHRRCFKWNEYNCDSRCNVVQWTVTNQRWVAVRTTYMSGAWGMYLRYAWIETASDQPLDDGVLHPDGKGDFDGVYAFIAVILKSSLAEFYVDRVYYAPQRQTLQN